MFCCLFITWLAAGSRVLELTGQRPLSPDGGTSTATGLQWTMPAIALEVQPLPAKEFGQYLKDMGASAESLGKNAHLFNREKVLAVRIRLRNLGEDVLTFNTDQTLLRTVQGMAGSLLDMAELWPTWKEEESQERLARLFARGSSTLQPGEELEQLLVFLPLGSSFPKRVVLHFDRIYYGTEVIEFKCEYTLRYRK